MLKLPQVVGADRIVRNGDTANKVHIYLRVSVGVLNPCTQIGTYNAAVLSARHRIPFIVVAPISTVDLDVSDGSKYGLLAYVLSRLLK